MVKSADISLPHLTIRSYHAVPCVGLRTTQTHTGHMETSQILLAGVLGGFSQVLLFSPHLLIGPAHMS